MAAPGYNFFVEDIKKGKRSLGCWRNEPLKSWWNQWDSTRYFFKGSEPGHDANDRAFYKVTAHRASPALCSKHIVKRRTLPPTPCHSRPNLRDDSLISSDSGHMRNYNSASTRPSRSPQCMSSMERIWLRKAMSDFYVLYLHTFPYI